MALLRSIAAALLPSDRCAAPDLATPRERGIYGERVASRFLRRNGYRVLHRNFRVRRGEIDLVCREGETLVFVEVKTRESERFGRGAEAVDEDKQKSISRAAVSWLKELGNPGIHFRFDIVEVLLESGRKPECRLIRNAHGLSRPFFY